MEEVAQGDQVAWVDQEVEWSQVDMGGGKVQVDPILTPTGWEPLVVLACPLHLDPGLSGVPGHEERGEDQADHG